MRHSMLQYRSVCCASYSGSPPNCQRKNYRIITITDMICVTIAICSQDCANGGTCTAPDACTCSAGWTGQYCTDGE